MKLHNFALLTAILLSVISCKGNLGSNTADELSINVDSLEKDFPFNSMFPFERAVFLESSLDDKISDVHRVFDIDSLYIIWDKRGSSVFVYNKEGKFLNHIGAKGHAKNEYVSLNDVYVNAKARQVCLLDNAAHKILHFDYNGAYRKTTKIKEWAIGFAIDNDYIWLESDGQNKESALLLKTKAETGEIIKSYFPMKNDGRVPIQSEKTFFTDADGKILFASPYLNSIYTIENGEIAPLVKLDFGKDAVDDSDLTSETYISKLQGGNYIGHIKDVFRSKDFLFISFRKYWNDNIEGYHALYNLSNKKKHIYDDTLLHDFTLPIFPTADVVGAGSHGLIFSIDLSLFNDDILSKFPGYENLTADSVQINQILILYDVN